MRFQSIVQLFGRKKTYKDTLKHDKIDWHQYLKRFKIRPKRDCVMVATINIHSIQDIGRLYLGRRNWVDFYQSGYRDGVECIMLKREGVKLPSDVW